MVRELQRYRRVAAADDVALRELPWFRREREDSERSWRDLVRVLEAGRGQHDLGDTRCRAAGEGGADPLEQALVDAGWPA